MARRKSYSSEFKFKIAKEAIVDDNIKVFFPIHYKNDLFIKEYDLIYKYAGSIIKTKMEKIC